MPPGSDVAYVPDKIANGKQTKQRIEDRREVLSKDCWKLSRLETKFPNQARSAQIPIKIPVPEAIPTIR